MKPKQTPVSQHSSITPVLTEILVAENKHLELFVKSFHYESENITTKHLGRIFGFFEITNTDEDNAYIVNFLASVVKKEYFQNTKRSAAESFEAALHKVNLALTELVKQGNAAWLGSLEATIAVLEDDTLHFSVTGDAAIFLYRNTEGHCISDGLADKDAALHPLKTFLEISSGKLLPKDLLLFTSPELFELLNEETLAKNADRMTPEAFTRYIRTALVNELSLGASLVMEIQETRAASVPKKATAEKLHHEAEKRLSNIFSGASFNQSPKLAAPTAPLIEETELEEEDIEAGPLEYTDEKTGHIYVQGDTPLESLSEPSRMSLFWQDNITPFIKNIKKSTGQSLRKSQKLLLEQGAALGSSLGDSLGELKNSSTKAVSAASSKVLDATTSAAKNLAEETREKYRASKETPSTVTAEQITHDISFEDETIVAESITFSSYTRVSRTPAEETLLAPEPEPVVAPKTKPAARRLSEVNTLAPAQEAAPKSALRPVMTPLNQSPENIHFTSPFSSAHAPAPTGSIMTNLTAGITTGLATSLGNGLGHLKPLSQKIRISLQHLWPLIVNKLSLLQPLLSRYFSPFLAFCERYLGVYTKKVLWALGILLVFLLLWILWPSTTETPQEAAAPSTTTAAPSTTSGTTPTSAATLKRVTAFEWQSDFVALLDTKNGAFVVTKDSIVSQSGNTSFPNGSVHLATFMPDLGIIFLLSTKNELVAYNIVDKKFTPNTLPIPEGAKIDEIGAYLTYLYTLDNTTGAIYRFPRTTNGFTESTTWLKASLGKSTNRTMAVSDTIRISDTTTKQYLKGAKEKDLSNEAFSVLGLSDQQNFTLGLNPNTGSLIVWDTDGNAVYQKTYPELSGAKGISYNESSKTLLIAESNTLVEYSLSW